MAKRIKIGNVNIITDMKKLDILAESVRSRGIKLDADIHRLACSAVHHRIKSGDNTYYQRVLDVLPKGTRVNALMAWFEVYGSVRFDKDLKRYKNTPDLKPAEMMDKLTQGVPKPFWLQSQKEGVAYSSITDIDGVLKYLGSHISKAEKAKDDEYVSGLKASVSYLQATREKLKAREEADAEKIAAAS